MKTSHIVPTPQQVTGYPNTEKLTAGEVKVPLGKCPFLHGSRQPEVTKPKNDTHGQVYMPAVPSHVSPTQGTGINELWKDRLQVELLHQHDRTSNPFVQDEDYNYAEEFKKLDLELVKEDLRKLMTDSQEWWPADHGHYGPFFVRMAWHAAGTYRSTDGRGGAGSGDFRFAPLNSWPDNANLDKSRRLLWPIKQKYGKKLSWADLFVLTGNVALDSMGFKTLGFGGGREDIWSPQMEAYWGSEREWLADSGEYKWLGDHSADVRYNLNPNENEGKREVTDPQAGQQQSENLENPLGASHFGLIYVNPEGPGGQGNPWAAAHDIRQTFGRMAMNDEETVALIAGGHTFGKCHGAVGGHNKGPEPEAADIEEQGFGWTSSHPAGTHTITSGVEVTWTNQPTQWTHYYFESLFKHDKTGDGKYHFANANDMTEYDHNSGWKEVESPAGARQYEAYDADPDKDAKLEKEIPLAFGDGTQRPRMLVTDIALIADPAYRKVSQKFLDEPDTFAREFAKAWLKLTHRDMGPITRYLGADIPKEHFIWQDPVAPADDDHRLSEEDVKHLKDIIKESIRHEIVTCKELVFTAWAAASVYRDTDKRGGVNGARIALEPQIHWEANNMGSGKSVAHVLDHLKELKTAFDDEHGKVSLADLIVLAGNCGVEWACSIDLKVPFKTGRMDADEDTTDANSFRMLEPQADGFRNFKKSGVQFKCKDEEMLLDKAFLLTLNAKEMTALLGGLRVLDCNHNGSDHGVLTHTVGHLDNAFFVNLLDMSTKWSKQSDDTYIGKDRETGVHVWTASRVDLAFGSNSQLRAYAEVYASDDGNEKFCKDFVKAWVKVMELDRFDLHR